MGILVSGSVGQGHYKELGCGSNGGNFTGIMQMELSLLLQLSEWGQATEKQTPYSLSKEACREKLRGFFGAWIVNWDTS